MTTEILNFIELTSAGSNKFTYVNENYRRLEAMTVSVLSRTNLGPPAGVPADGSAYIVDVSTGDWSSFPVNSIAHYYLGTWKNYAAVEGVRVTVLDEFVLVSYNGTDWINIVTASIGQNDWIVETADITVASGDRRFVDLNSNNITVTLPSTANIGDTIEIADITTAVTNGATDFTLTINNNGLNIEGSAQTITSNLPGKVFKLTYSNASYGWKLFK